MLHTVPAQGWGTHCFFRYDALFFKSLCNVNNYNLIFLKPFLRLKPFMKHFDKKIDQIVTMCHFLKTEMVEYAKNEDILFDPYYGNNKINGVLLGIGCGGSLFNVTMGCVCQKRDDSSFVTPFQVGNSH